MIKIDNLTKKYQNQLVINNVSLTLPSKGLVSFVGPSGCGKSTLLNAISGLISYEGKIIIDGINLQKYDMAKSNNFRLNNIGFIFQDFKLFELDSVEHNISFPSDVARNYKTYRNDIHLRDLLAIVELQNKRKQLVKNLSGGEKQRTAIARALVNDPKIILADEPTGALDEYNAYLVMDTLKIISKDRLVIVVSHDLNLVNKYSDIIYQMNDGKIIDICKKKQLKTSNNLKIIKTEYENKKHYIPFRFLINHTYQYIKERKWRSTLISLVTSLGLIGVGLAVSLSSTISDNIKKACASILTSNQLIVSKESSNSPTSIVSKSYDDVLAIKNDYQEYISDIGVIYKNNFNQLFKDDNYFSFYSNGTNIVNHSYSLININEFSWLDNYDYDYLPARPTYLALDEIVLNLSMGQINDICFQLHLIRTADALADYIKENDLYFVLTVKNTDWDYVDQQLFKIKAFRIDYDPVIYHYDHLFNEKIMENNMRLPNSLNISGASYYPWTLKKLYYFEIKGDRDKFIQEFKYDENHLSTLLEIPSKEYFPLTIEYDTPTKDINKLLVLENTVNQFPFTEIKRMNEVMEELEYPLLGSKGGYLIFPEALFMGFSNYTYFSFDEEKLMTSLDEYSSTSIDISSLDFKDNILIGHYSKSKQNGVIFSQLPNNSTFSGELDNLDNVVISTGLYHQLVGQNKSFLYVGFTRNEQKLNNGNIYRDFVIRRLNVVGLINEEGNVIYQKQDWLINYYQCRVGISIFNLGVNNISYSLKEGYDTDTVINKFLRAFPNYQIDNPVSEINTSVDEVCSYIELAMIAFSFIAILISTFLLSVCNYLHILEIKKDIGLSRCMGVSNKESSKFVYYHSYLMGLIAFILSSSELIILNFIISKFISNYLFTSHSFSLNPLAFLYMFLLTFLVCTVSSFFISFKVKKLDPLDALKDI